MYRIMYEEQGIGLAAPQAGDGRRVFVIDLPTEDDEEPIRFTMVNPEIQGREGSEQEPGPPAAARALGPPNRRRARKKVAAIVSEPISTITARPVLNSD